MGEIAIRAQSLSKSYRIDHETGARYRTLRESLASLASNPLRKTNRTSHETIWALKDVSFEVNRGEALGIIGRNGAGKSTLLKVLTRVTSPSGGRAEVYGRLSSLLEVGTGFHPELTGRENIFLNGAILGMSRREIRRRFDEIIAFAETERFLDTPVKRYSTGMYLRLAFAVAAHLETDILVVDEVLAVGDTAFQQKCLGKMEDVTSHGRTVLFVSHNLAAVTRLCTRALLLSGGRVSLQGSSDTVVAEYLSGATKQGQVRFRRGSERDPIKGAAFEWAELRSSDSRIQSDFSIGDDIILSFRIRLALDRPATRLAVGLRAADGTPVALVQDEDSGFSLRRDWAAWDVAIRFADVRFYPGSYFVSLWVHNASNSEIFDHVEDCLEFQIVGGGRLTGRSLARNWGFLFLTPGWQADRAGESADIIATPRLPESTQARSPDVDSDFVA